ncbi:hypothetical protein RCL1_001632 [Eukaryota sp. TZLM3-RCL]
MFANFVSDISSSTSIAVQVEVSDDILSHLELSSVDHFISILKPLSQVPCSNQSLTIDNQQVSVNSIRLRFVSTQDALYTLPKPEAINKLLAIQHNLVPSIPESNPTSFSSHISSGNPPVKVSSSPNSSYFHTLWTNSLFSNLLSLAPSSTTTVGNGQGDGLPSVSLYCCSTLNSDPLKWFASKYHSSVSSSLFVLFEVSHSFPPPPPAPRADSQSPLTNESFPSINCSIKIKEIQDKISKSLGPEKCLFVSSFSTTSFDVIVRRVASTACAVFMNKINETMSVEQLSKGRRWLKNLMTKNDVTNSQLLAEKESILGDWLLQLKLLSFSINNLKSCFNRKKSFNDDFGCAVACEGIGKAHLLLVSDPIIDYERFGKSIDYFTRSLQYFIKFHHNSNQNDCGSKWMAIRVGLILSYLLTLRGRPVPPPGSRINPIQLFDSVSVLICLSELLLSSRKEGEDYCLSVLCSGFLYETASINLLNCNRNRSWLLYQTKAATVFSKLLNISSKFSNHVIRIVYELLEKDEFPTPNANLSLISHVVSANTAQSRHHDVIILIGLALSLCDGSITTLSESLFDLLSISASQVRLGISETTPFHLFNVPILINHFLFTKGQVRDQSLPESLIPFVEGIRKQFKITQSLCRRKCSFSTKSVFDCPQGESLFSTFELINPLQSEISVSKISLKYSIANNSPQLLTISDSISEINLPGFLLKIECKIESNSQATRKILPFEKNNPVFTIKMICCSNEFNQKFHFHSIIFGISTLNSGPIFFEHSITSSIFFSDPVPLLEITANNLQSNLIDSEITPFTLSISNYGFCDAFNVSVWPSDPSIVYFKPSRDQEEIEGVEGSKRLLTVTSSIVNYNFQPPLTPFDFDCPIFGPNSNLIDNFLTSNIMSPSSKAPSLVIPCIKSQSNLIVDGFLRCNKPGTTVFSCAVSPLGTGNQITTFNHVINVTSSVRISAKSIKSDCNPSSRVLKFNLLNLHSSANCSIKSISLVSKSNTVAHCKNFNSNIFPATSLNSPILINSVNSGCLRPGNCYLKETTELILSSTSREALNITPELRYFISYELLIRMVPGFHPRSPPPLIPPSNPTSASPNAAFLLQQAYQIQEQKEIQNKLYWPKNCGLLITEWNCGKSNGFSLNFDLETIKFDEITARVKPNSEYKVKQFNSVVISLFNSFKNPLSFSLKLENEDLISYNVLQHSGVLMPFENYSFEIFVRFSVSGFNTIPEFSFEISNGFEVKSNSVVVEVFE